MDKNKNENKNENNKKLAEQIWFTRVSRAKAETRLINKEHYIQFINIYYSLFSVIFSIIALLKHDDQMSLFTIIITICLLVSIMYLNGQKYLSQATDYRNNYTQLQKLEMELEDPKCDIKEIQTKYCELLKTSSNHIEYDYLSAIENASNEYKEKKNWKEKKIYFLFGRGWRFIVKLFFILVPIALLYVCEVYLS